MGRDEYLKFIEDESLDEMHLKWLAYNDGKGMPIFNSYIYPTYEMYKEIFIREYKKLGID